MYRLVYLSYLCMVASAGVTFVFLEDVEQLYGIPSWGIGLISSLAFLTAVLSALLIAPLGDRGLLRALGIFAFAAAIAGNLWIGFATELWSLAASRGLGGLGVGVFAVVGRKALIGETTDGGAEKIGGFVSAAVAGFIGGPALGAWLGELGGIETPYLAISGALILLAVPTIKYLVSVPIAVSERTTVANMIPLFKSRKVRAATAGYVAVFFNIGVFDATVDEYLTGLGASNAQVGLILIIVGAPLLFIPRLAGRAVDTSSRTTQFLLIALAIFVPIVLTLGVWEGIAVFTVLAFLQTTTESVIFPAANRLVIDEAGAANSAVGTSMLDATGSLAGGISAFFAPILFDLTDGPLGSFGGSGLVCLGLLFVAWTNARADTQPNVEA